MKPYRYLAEYYDDIFAFARAWLDRARGEILGRILPRVESACDLCCGTGSAAVSLASKGIRVYAVDVSPRMCRKARKKIRRARLPVRVIRADMRDFRLPEPVDLITCEFDALNHVPEPSNLPAVVECVARALKPGGWFYFDVNMQPAFEHAWPNTWFLETRDVAVVMQGGYDPERIRAWTNVHWFIRDGSRWLRREERVEEICWTDAEIRSTLRIAGFTSVKSWDAAPLLVEDKTIRPGFRTFYLARKRAG